APPAGCVVPSNADDQRRAVGNTSVVVHEHDARGLGHSRDGIMRQPVAVDQKDMTDEIGHLSLSNGRPGDPVTLERILRAERVAARLNAPAAERNGDGRRPAEVSKTGTSDG